MYPLTLKDFTYIPEGQFYDRKSSRKEPKEIAHHLIAFANSGGGILAIGIEDEGELSGFNIEGANPPEVFKNVVLDYCKTPIQVKINSLKFNHSDGKEDFVLIFKVEPSYNFVAENTDGEIFIRLDDSTMKLPFNKLELLQKDKSRIRFEDLPEERATIKDLDLDIVEEYKNILNSSLSLESFLLENKFTIDGVPTKGALILFGKKPSNFIPSARLRYLFYKDDPDSVQPKTEENISFKEGLISLLRNSKEILEPRLSLASNSNYWFEDTIIMMIYRDFSYSWEYPRIILYNANKLLYSPYSKPSYITMENVTYARWPENERITNTLINFGWINEINQGIKNLYASIDF